MTQENEKHSIPEIMRRHPFQKQPSEHFDLEDVLDDYELCKKICYLYDIGITVKMIKAVYLDIESERAEDNRTDNDSIENRDYY